MPRKKFSNDILAANGGLDSARALREVMRVMTTHDLKQPVMYQFILTGSTTKAAYQATIKSLIRRIRSRCRAEYFGAFEVGEEKGGLHAHCFVIIETLYNFPGDILNVNDGKYLHKLANRHKINRIGIAPPQNPMHGGQFFARLNTEKKLADCIKWATYILKARSKDAVQGREKYFGSEFSFNTGKREAKRQKYRDALVGNSPVSHTAALPAAKEEVSVADASRASKSTPVAQPIRIDRDASHPSAINQIEIFKPVDFRPGQEYSDAKFPLRHIANCALGVAGM